MSLFFFCQVCFIVVTRDHLNCDAMDFLATAHTSAAAGQTRRNLSEKKHLTLLWCQEVLLSPVEEARVGARQMLSRMVANNLMIGVLA